jgi:uncharacterized membrane protein
MQTTPIPSFPLWRLFLWSGTFLALATPWVLMRYTDQGAWTVFDFLVFGVLVGGVCVGVELAMRLSNRWAYRLAAIVSVLGGFLMVWANLAVGIIGSEENPQNLIFYVVLLIGLFGSLITRFTSRGLMWTLRLMAAAQLAIFVIAAGLGWALLPVFTIFYCLLWLVAAELFERSTVESGTL